MNLRKAAEMALEVLDGIHRANMTPIAEESWNKAIETLRQALEEPEQVVPEQDPVAWVEIDSSGNITKFRKKNFLGGVALYTGLNTKWWVDLTIDERHKIVCEMLGVKNQVAGQALARRIENRLWEKNGWVS